MSIHFHSLLVKHIKRETADAVSVQLEIPEQLKKAFHFRHGQSLTMRAWINGQESQEDLFIMQQSAR